MSGNAAAVVCLFLNDWLVGLHRRLVTWLLIVGLDVWLFICVNVCLCVLEACFVAWLVATGRTFETHRVGFFVGFFEPSVVLEVDIESGDVRLYDGLRVCDFYLCLVLRIIFNGNLGL